MTNQQPTITYEDIQDIDEHVKMCALRAIKYATLSYLTADDLEQDYYTWLLLKKKRHNPSYTLHRMIDRIRTYTHFNRDLKKSSVTTVNHEVPEIEDTHADSLQQWQANHDAATVISRLKLPRRTRRIMKLAYIDGKNQTEIGAIVGLCGSRISQLLAEGRRAAKVYYINKETKP